ncbi:MAG TPA: tetratricopeptide repeat protein [Ignavibacteria bacterium]|nr:tetratricopeptide repeat protein [Ignavibacteria bacterium]
MLKIKYVTGLVLLFSLMFMPKGFSQSLRSSVNTGVEKYQQKNYSGAEANFKKGLEKVPNNFQANFNLGDSYYKQKRYNKAIKAYEQALLTGKNNILRSKVYHNIGNVLLQSKKIKESIGAYKKSLELNPGDMSTKYNLSYALNLLKHNKSRNKNNKNKNKNKNKDKNNKNNKNQQNNKKQQNKQNQNKNNQQKQKNQKQNQQPQNKNERRKNNKQSMKNPQQGNKMTKAEANRILAALRHDELKLAKQLRRKKGKPIKTAKDW